MIRVTIEATERSGGLFLAQSINEQAVRDGHRVQMIEDEGDGAEFDADTTFAITYRREAL